MLKLLKWEEVVLVRGPMFGVDPVGSKPFAHSDSFRTYNLSKKSIYNNSNTKNVHDICVRSYKKKGN